MVEIKCIAKGKDISERLKENLKNITVVDHDGTNSDELYITLTNYIKRPEPQDDIKIWIEGKFYGIFFVQSTKTDWTNELTINATSANFSQKQKQKKNANYLETTLHTIVAETAARHGLRSKIDFPDIAYESIMQEKESDLHFCRRLAEKYDALFSIKNDTLLFLSRDTQMPTFTIDINDCRPWEIEHLERKEYGSCAATYRDTKMNENITKTTGSGEPVLRVTDEYISEDEAQIVAKGKLAESKRGTKKGTLSKRGEYLAAGGKLILTGSKQDDGEYTINTVTTSFDQNQGFRVGVEFQN